MEVYNNRASKHDIDYVFNHFYSADIGKKKEKLD